MTKFIISFLLLFTNLLCLCQTSDFAVVSSAVSNNNAAFTVGEIFVVGKNSSGFLGAHLTTSIIVSTDEIEENHSENRIEFFPNPAVDFIKFDVAPDKLLNKRLKLYSSTGELVLDHLLSGNVVSLPVLNVGLYNATVEDYKGFRIVILR